MKVVRLSVLRTSRLYPQEIFLLLIRPHGHSAARRIMWMQNSNDTIGSRTRDLPACSEVPQPTASSRTPKEKISYWSWKSLDTLLCKRLWTCRKTSYAVNEWCRVSSSEDGDSWFLRSGVTCLTNCTSQKTVVLIFTVVRAWGSFMLITMYMLPLHLSCYLLALASVCPRTDQRGSCDPVIVFCNCITSVQWVSAWRQSKLHIKLRCISVEINPLDYRTGRLMQYREITYVCYENQTKHINTRCEQNVVF
jgi:hypothetical protein